ncbi:MAG: MFS transporter [Dermatophilaceae bacterium]
MSTEPIFINQKFTERFPALASRDFRLFLSGQAISVIGTMMQNTVQPYLAYRITGQPFYLGLVGFAAALPAALFTLPGGVLVERLDKRKLVIFLQAVFTIQALVMGILALTGVITIWHIIVLAMVNGVAQAIEIPARQSMLIHLAGRKALPNAIALQSTAFNVARVVGPSLAAPILVLFSTSGEGWAFIINAISYLFVIGGLMAIGRGKPPSDPVEKAPRRSALAEFREGQAYIRANSIIILLIAAVAVQSTLAFPISQLLPAFCPRCFGPIWGWRKGGRQPERGSGNRAGHWGAHRRGVYGRV